MHLKMKKSSVITIALLMSLTFGKAFSQIPNPGFENWDSFPGFIEPSEWQTANAFATGTFYPVTRSTDVYPAGSGNYSIRIENNPSLLPGYEAYGYAMTGYLQYPGPVFPIQGHPTSLKGYYKFIPDAGDTMVMGIILYKTHIQVAFGKDTTTTPVPSWTPFEIPIPDYADADSAIIMFATYYSIKTNGKPHGNSVLYLDNLSFDTTGSTNIFREETDPFIIYPNPVKNVLFFQGNLNTGHTIINIFNKLGESVLVKTLGQFDNSLDISMLKPGIYILEFNDSKKRTFQKIIKIENSR